MAFDCTQEEYYYSLNKNGLVRTRVISFFRKCKEEGRNRTSSRDKYKCHQVKSDKHVDWTILPTWSNIDILPSTSIPEYDQYHRQVRLVGRKIRNHLFSLCMNLILTFVTCFHQRIQFMLRSFYFGASSKSASTTVS